MHDDLAAEEPHDEIVPLALAVVKQQNAISTWTCLELRIDSAEKHKVGGEADPLRFMLCIRETVMRVPAVQIFLAVG